MISIPPKYRNFRSENEWNGFLQHDKFREKCICKGWTNRIGDLPFLTFSIKVIPLVLHYAPSTEHNIATSKMAPVLPTSAKRTNKGRFCRAKAFIRNNNAAHRLTTSWFAIEKQENERNVRYSEVCNGFSLRGRRVVELLKCPG